MARKNVFKAFLLKEITSKARRKMNEKIYEIEFFINFYGSLNVVDWKRDELWSQWEAGTCWCKFLETVGLLSTVVIIVQL